VFLEFIW